jgi:hypothetical protein
MARTVPETRTVVGQANLEEVSSDSDDSDESEKGIPAPDVPSNAKIMGRHIAAHFQGLMLLTIRFAALLRMSDVSDNVGDADSVNIDRCDTTNSVEEIPVAYGVSSTTSNDVPPNTDDIVPECVSIPDAMVNLRRLLGLPGGSDEASGVDERYSQH